MGFPKTRHLLSLESHNNKRHWRKAVVQVILHSLRDDRHYGTLTSAHVKNCYMNLLKVVYMIFVSIFVGVVFDRYLFLWVPRTI